MGRGCKYLPLCGVVLHLADPQIDDLDPKISLARGCCVSGQIGADALLLLVVATFHYEICIDRK